MLTRARQERRLLCAAAIFLFAASLAPAGPPGPSPQSSDVPDSALDPAPANDDVRATVQAAYGRLPLSFEPNRGQTAAEVDFLGRGAGYTVFLTSASAVLALQRRIAPEAPDGESAAEPAGARLAIQLVDAAASAPVGQQALPGQVSYLRGSDPGQWQTGIPTYAAVRYPETYPGIDLVYYGAQGQLEYDFVVAPGADPGMIRVAFEGADEVELDAQGDLLLRGGEWTLRQRKPAIYQESDGVRAEIAGGYVLHGTREVGFALGPYDASRPLVIDPVLAYSTYLGGINIDVGTGIAVDSAGNAYVTGQTFSPGFPTTPGAFQAALGGSDAFVTKLNAAGNALVYSTFLGGTGADGGNAIAVDSAGNAYVTGGTQSTNFPTTPGAVQPSYGGGGTDAFVTKLNATGTALVYSTYLGGSNYDFGYGIAVDSAGNAYVTGSTSSTNFPTTPGAFQTALSGGLGDAFITKLNAAGNALDYSTYLGGSDQDLGNGIAVDSAGNAYVTGQTISTNFPTTPGAFQPARSGSYDAFVTKLNAAGNALVYSTYLGGSANDEGLGIAVDSAGNAYVTGQTISTNFPTTPGAIQPSFGGGDFDAFVTKLNPAGTALVYSTYLGGSDLDSGAGIAVDSAGGFYVTGRTSSANFPTTPGAFQTAWGGNGCGGRSLFPCSDAFITKIGEVADLALTKTASPNPVILGMPLTYTLVVANNGPESATAVTVTDSLPSGLSLSSSTASQGSCTTTSGTVVCSLGGLANGASASITLTLATTAPGTLTNTATVTSGAVDPNPANNTATITSTVLGPCAPRPEVGVSVQPGGGGLQVTIRANTSAATPSNALQALRFAAGTNTLLDLPGGPSGVTGSLTVPLPAGTMQTTFVVRQATAGQAATLPLVVVDGCGDWPTLVGGGASVFVSASAGTAAGGTGQTAPSPASAPGPSPTAGSTTAASSVLCAPRPPVTVASAPDGPGRLRVTVSVGTTSALPTNALRTLRFGAATNALIDAGGQTGASGEVTLSLPPGTTQTTFVVRRGTSGQATTVPVIVTDACGEWPTTVGGGPNAF